MEILFIILLGVIFYTFVGYPLLLKILVIFFEKPVVKKEREDITVSIIIAAYNEEDVIEKKIKNTLDLDYPKENLEIIIASDGSTDNTDRIVKRSSSKGVILNRIEGRKGKTEIQNQSVAIANGQIIVFSDANSFYQKDAIKAIVRNFYDPEVGGVCGKLIYVSNDGEEDDSENVYWKFENYLKTQEGKLSSVLGANGSIYAIRKECYVPLAPHLISDFVEPLRVVENGKRVAFEPEAIAVENIESVSGKKALMRKVRINNRTIFGLIDCLLLANIFKYGFVSFQFISHKFFRYFMPFSLLSILAINPIILYKNPVWGICLVLQLTFYGFALIGVMTQNKPVRAKLFSISWYFVWTHLALLIAWIQYIKGEKKVVWDTIR